jgi:sugar-specific transcriptional regulator TrmB
VYVALVRAGTPLNGYEVAKRSRVPRSAVYQTLEKLVERGIVFLVGDDSGQRTYGSLDVDALVKRLRTDFDQSLDVVSKELRKAAAPQRVDVIYRLAGEETVFRHACELIDSASEAVHVSAWAPALEKIEQNLVSADDRTEVWLMSWGSPRDVGIDNQYSNPLTSEGTAIDRSHWIIERAGCQPLIVVADRSRAVVAGATNNEVWGVQTDDPAIVMLALEAIVHFIVVQASIDRYGAAAVLASWEEDARLMRLLHGGRVDGTGTDVPAGSAPEEVPRAGGQS